MVAQKGQILLVVILVVIVASTIGLSVASRTITSLRTSTEEAESQKALAAAEAGIERAIQGRIPMGAGISLGTGVKFLTEVDDVKDSSFLLNGGNIISKNEGTDVWLVEHDDNGNPDYSNIVSPQSLSLYWGTSPEEGCEDPKNMPAAIQVIAFSRDPVSPNNVKTYRYAFDKCFVERGNNFTEADGGGNLLGKDFKNSSPDQKDELSKLIKKENRNNIVLLRVIPLYKDTVIGVETCKGKENKHEDRDCVLPTQGYVITSTGTSGQANRKLTYFKGYGQTYLPYVSYGLFVAN